MSLTFTNVIDGAIRDFTLPGGLRIAQFDMTSSDVSADYSSGFDLAGAAAQMGFHKVFGILDAAIRQDDNTLRGLNPIWDGYNGKLAFLETCVSTPDHPEADTDIEDGDIVRVTVFGV